MLQLSFFPADYPMRPLKLQNLIEFHAVRFQKLQNFQKR